MRSNMSKVFLDSATSGAFRQFTEPVELIDESGLPIGTFIPVEKKPLNQTLEIPFATGELQRFKSEAGGRSLGEILADLENQS
jgi:hypothetical protein